LAINVAHVPYLTCGNRSYIVRFLSANIPEEHQYAPLAFVAGNMVGFEYEVELRA